MNDMTRAIEPDALERELQTLRKHFNPARERLWAKIAGLEQDLALVSRSKLGAGDRDLAAVLDGSATNVRKARACFEGWWGHPHLAWRFLHRVDEDLLLLVPFEDFKARALEVRTSFELNIAEPSVRAAWLGTEGGEKGSLVTAIEALKDGDKPGPREIVRAALQMVNEQVDRRFWALSANVLTSVWSGTLLAAAMVVCALLWNKDLSYFARAAEIGKAPLADFLPVAVFGAMGAYVSNLLTRQDFLFVPGGPHWRYFLHPIVAKPVLSGFAALFVHAVARSGLIFTMGPGASGEPASGVVQLGIPPGEATAFSYVVLALVSGFAADKLLREMIDRVLKRLEARAEKTVKTENGEA